MQTAVLTLTDFLLARIAEDEAAARAAAPVWDSQPWSQLDIPAREHAESYWSPTTVLAECDAKRRIVACIQRWLDTGYPTLDHVFFAMALPYADHPDYNEAWRP